VYVKTLLVFSLVLFIFDSLRVNVLHGLPNKAGFRKKMGIGLFARLKLAIHLIWKNIFLYNIRTKNMIFPQNWGSPNTHLFDKRGHAIKTMHQ